MEQPDTLVLVTRRGMGHADESLQEHVFGVWLKLTLENGTLPGAIAFYTDGVRLACEGSPVLEELEALEARGVHLILCKTCLDAFGITDTARVGVIGGMGDIIAAQTKAAKVITL
ncbi:MAG: DsrE family protein [Planctomycetota bacterium]|nr:DsrE family protein [Planctomycetota bacterium]